MAQEILINTATANLMEPSSIPLIATLEKALGMRRSDGLIKPAFA